MHWAVLGLSCSMWDLSLLCMSSDAQWDLSSLTRDQTRTPCTGTLILNHWTTREVPSPGFLKAQLYCHLCNPLYGFIHTCAGVIKERDSN